MAPTTANGRKAVHFGGGNIGRGFMAPIFHRDGYKIVFVDVDQELVDRFGKAKSYKVKELDSRGEITQSLEITNFEALNSREVPEQVVEEIATADIVTCAIGAPLLKFIAGPIAKGIKARAANKQPVAIIACENAVRATDVLKALVMKELDEATAKKKAVFSNSAVDRIVPNDQVQGSLDVKVEEFYEWCIEKGPFGTNAPVLSLARFVDDLDYFIQRKLWTVNAAHAITAYVAHVQGIPYIHEAIAKPEIERAVRAALKETSELLLRMYPGTQANDQEQYVNKVINRFKNPALKDSPKRVGRGPLRKMSIQDRLVGPANKQALATPPRSYKGLLYGMDMALRFQNVPDEKPGKMDEESVEMAKIIRENSAEEATKKIVQSSSNNGIAPPLFKDIVALVQKLKDNPAAVFRVGSPARPASPVAGRGSPGRPASPATGRGSPGRPASPAAGRGSPGRPASPAAGRGSPGRPASPVARQGSPPAGPASARGRASPSGDRARSPVAANR